MWKLACCGGGYLQILGRSGYDKWEWALSVHSIPVIYSYLQKVVLKRKNSQIHLSVSPVIEEGEPCCLYLEDLFVEKKVFLPRFVRKLFHSQRTNHQSSANSPFSLGLRSSGISARLCVPSLTSRMMLWFSSVLLQIWGNCASSELMASSLIPIRSFGVKLSLGILDNDDVRF